MNKDNKNTEVNDTDKKLHISDVICSLTYQPTYVETICEGVFSE